MPERTSLSRLPLLIGRTPASGQPPSTGPGRSGSGPDRSAPPEETDWALVGRLRRAAAETLSREGAEVSVEAGGAVVDRLIDRERTRHRSRGQTPMTDDGRLRGAVLDALFGMGRLQSLLDDPDVENIEVFGFDRVHVERRDGHVVAGPPIADSDDDLIDLLRGWAARSADRERPFSPADPELHLRLEDGSRLAATAWSSPRPAIAIRRHRLRRVTLDQLVGLGMLSADAASFLAASVRSQRTIVVCGPQGAGKTTLLRALCAAMDPWERVGTIETEFELGLHELPDQHHRVVAWEYRPGSGERAPDGTRAGEVTLEQLTRASWRFSLSRLILGEVRGAEVNTMLSAMAGGAGAMCTVHASSARAAVERLVTLAMAGGPQVSADHARRQVGQHVDLIVALRIRRDSPKHRYVDQIVAVEPGEGNSAALTDVYGTDGGQVLVQQHLPEGWHDLVDHGFDPWRAR